MTARRKYGKLRATSNYAGMKTHADKTVKSKKSRRIKGIIQAARILGVSRSHLWRVLHGKRESRRLSRAYAEYLIAQE